MSSARHREKNEELYVRVMAGDEQARREMIESNMPLVGSNVNEYVRKHPGAVHLRDDLRSAGYVGLVQAVGAMAKHSDPENSNPTGYMSIAIRREISRFSDNEDTISIPDRTQREARKENRPLDVPSVRRGIPKSVADSAPDASRELAEMRDLLDSCCESEDERTILRMREEGHADRDIAEEIGLAHTTTYMMRRELEQRYQQKIQELEE